MSKFSDDPREWSIESDRDGFYLMDPWGEDRSPTFRFQSFATAQNHLDEAVREFLENYEPPELGDAWAGGIADNN